LLYAGITFLLVGAIFMFPLFGTYADIADPNQNNILKLGIGEQQEIAVSDGCYVAWSQNLSKNIDVNIFTTDDAINPIANTGCGYEIEAMDENNNQFRRIGSWQLDDGDYYVHSICQSNNSVGCNNGEIMLVDYDATFNEIFSNLSFWFACFICVAGVILLPLGAVLLHFSRRGGGSRPQTIMVLNQETGEYRAEVINSPSNQVPITGEHPSRVAQGVISTEQESPLGPSGESMMSTDQIYSLLHGSDEEKIKAVEEAFSPQEKAENMVPDPFVDSKFKSTGFTESPFTTTTNPTSPTADTSASDEASEGAQWKDWDEG
jgi:hypothetical protein